MTEKGQLKDPLAKTKFITIRQPGMGGLNMKADPQDLKDDESPQMTNITYDSGVVGPRFGTTLVLAAPNGETGTPSQLLKTKDSNGTTYLIAVFGTNFYLFDSKTPQWIKLNGSYSPASSGLFYGSANWNLGTGKDAFYFGNGKDYVMKWIPMLARLAAPAVSSDTQITVTDPTQFPLGATSLLLDIGGNSVTITNNATGATIVITTQPTNGQTITFAINGTSVPVQFVNSIGSTAGNVLIGVDLATTFANLLALLQNPSVTSANQVAFSGPNQALISDFIYALITQSDNTCSFSVTPNGSVNSLAVAGTLAPTVTYTNPNNILTVSGTVGAIIPSGTAITNFIVPVPTIPQGNILQVATASGAGFRLFVAGVSGNQNILYYSQAYSFTTGGTPQENFVPSTGTFTAGQQPIIYGEGGIIDLQDYGAYLAVVKNNSISQATFTIDATDDTTDMVPAPIIYGESIFPIGQQVDLTIENALVITTAQGVYQFTPSSTGTSLTTTLTPFSDNILSIFNAGILSFTKGRMEFLNRLMFILASSIPGVNDLVLVNDYVWGNNWTIWNNLNAVDIKEANSILYFLCNDDGGLYFYDSTSYQDFRKGNAVGYQTSIFSKRFDWGEPANPKTQSLAMIQGYITPNTKLYVDVLYDEGGTLATSTYIIDGSNANYVLQMPIYTPGRVSLGQNPIGGAQIGTIGVFRVYLDLLRGIGAHVIQMNCYTSNPGDQWGLTGMSANPEVNEQIPSEMKLGIA